MREGYDYSDIIFNGPQKKEIDIEKILKNQGIINADNLYDVEMICKIFCNNTEKILGKVGIRVNFDLEKECFNETTAGNSVSRFGVCVENGDFFKAISLLRKYEVPISGLHLHYSTKD